MISRPFRDWSKKPNVEKSNKFLSRSKVDYCWNLDETCRAPEVWPHEVLLNEEDDVDLLKETKKDPMSGDVVRLSILSTLKP
jgi:hypothetical protein